ncbi:hypothetical protein [Pedobacter sp. KBS0701]|uniref:hypothetical protein n=1 Tax=unclassified Pedobacter TaxID=2628915 RepID=UPI00110F59BF|nr:hypothetical protein [Pedobacter sp. KBS0701]QDW25270.1 hypothetical protein FFJ24_010800 [Pedobacter sp. KBS0701]
MKIFAIKTVFLAAFICSTGINKTTDHLVFKSDKGAHSNSINEKHEPETQTFYGSAVTTNNWHNVTGIEGPRDESKLRVFAGAVCEKYTLSVSAPKGWHFMKDAVPRVNCVKNDQGAFEWNRFDVAKDRVYQNSRTSNYIEYSVWAGSRSIEINLACEAVKD